MDPCRVHNARRLSAKLRCGEKGALSFTGNVSEVARKSLRRPSGSVSCSFGPAVYRLEPDWRIVHQLRVDGNRILGKLSKTLGNYGGLHIQK